jgi:hypothetical protein
MAEKANEKLNIVGFDYCPANMASNQNGVFLGRVEQ